MGRILIVDDNSRFRALAAELLAARGKPAILDASGVQRLGAQCLQILLAARALWSSDGQPWRLVDPSPEFADAVALMGCPHLAAAQPSVATPQD